MIIKRQLTETIIKVATQFPVVAIVGPRQSGKTTLAQQHFPNHKYISLEDFDTRAIAETDPRRFLNDYPTAQGLILDEIQHAPQLLSYIQTIVDREKKNGFFVITGSQNFLVDESVTQTLAGRIAILTLFPLSISELEEAKLLPEKIEDVIYKGSYPRAYTDSTSIEFLYANYIRTYVERDVRQIKNVESLETFQRFMRLCAGRIGQVQNLSALGNDCGIDHKTAKAWINLLQASYIIFLLYPYYRNFGKTLTKAPKIYFVDTGLACSLLNIRSSDNLQEHYLRGNLVQSFIIGDILKQQHNLALRPNIYFWRDHVGKELDLIIDETSPIAIEIKAGKTIARDFFKELSNWQEITQLKNNNRYLIYGGDTSHTLPQAEVRSWKSSGTLIKEILGR